MIIILYAFVMSDLDLDVDNVSMIARCKWAIKRYDAINSK